MKLTGKNFQPWENFSLDIDGLTLIVGPSNRGKSSIFRSLKGILRNELSSDYVRNGQDDKMEVVLEVDGMPPIEALRSRKGTTEYRIGVDDSGKPIKFKALGDGIPEPMDKLKFGKIRIGDATMDPIFSEQNRAQFLIDPERWKPTELNGILGAFASTEKLDAGKKEANLRITQRNGEAKTLAEEIREAEERKGKIAILSEQADQNATRVNDLESMAQDAENRLSNTYEAIKHLARLTEVRRISSELRVPDISSAEKLHQTTELLFQAAGIRAKLGVLSGCNKSLDEMVGKWELVVKSHKIKRELLSLLAIKGREGPSPRECSDQLETLLSSAKLVLSSASALSSIVEVSGKVEGARKNVTNKEAELLVAEAELETGNAEVARLKLESTAAEVAKCPKCGSPLHCTTCNPEGL
jgi:DNA repair exonuclease SbcCD ATPase subunit